MPLSEREQKILDEIEKSLATEDPRFADQQTFRGSGKAAGRRVRHGALIFLGGFALLIAFFISRLLIIGLLAFGGMVTGIVLLASAMSGLVKDATQRPGRDRKTFARSMSDWEDSVRKRFRRP